MFKINTLRNCYPIAAFFVCAIILILSPFKSQCQNVAFVNNGCNIYMQGTGNPSTNSSVSIHGNFLNLNDGILDGTIEQEAGHIWIDSNWINEAFNNVFTNFSGLNNDGFVTFENPNNVQFIQGFSPTHFENLTLKRYRKQLNVNNNIVNGVLEINAVLVLNQNNLILNNPNPLGINYLSGFIKSETLPGSYGTLQWNIGSSLGTFRVPFGSDNFAFNDLNYSINLKTPMGISDNITFATYPTDNYNSPLPIGASALELEPYKIVDRYWIIQPSDPLNNPTADMTFTYTSTDVTSGYNTLNLKTLKASRNNTTLGQWMDMLPRGTVSANTVTISDVQPSEFFAPWTLVNIPGPLANIFVPDAFTPDGDGLNDLFFPVFQIDFVVTSYEFMIFDRWGIIMFSTKDPLEGWNGKKNNIKGEPVNGVYTWLIIAKGYNSENDQTIELKDKITGRVTLYR